MQFFAGNRHFLASQFAEGFGDGNFDFFANLGNSLGGSIGHSRTNSTP